MERHISEADWKLLRQLGPVALERFCGRVLSEVVRLAGGTNSNHDRYLAVFDLIREQNEELSTAFDNMRRSTALMQIARIRSLGLVTDDEFARFSEETRTTVARFLGVSRA
jgi:hypothetical protein